MQRELKIATLIRFLFSEQNSEAWAE
jgi:hypothetical protein